MHLVSGKHLKAIRIEQFPEHVRLHQLAAFDLNFACVLARQHELGQEPVQITRIGAKGLLAILEVVLQTVLPMRKSLRA